MRVRVTYRNGTKVEMTKKKLLEMIRKAGKLMDAYRLKPIKKPKLLLIKEITVLRKREVK